MHSTSTIELSESAVQENVDFIRNILGKDVQYTSVVKSNAYGHGIQELIPMLNTAGVDSFAVFNADEAFKVKHALIGNATIIIMGYVHDDAIEAVVREGFEVYVSDSERAQKLAEAAQHIGKKAVVHLDLETGMNRTGLNYIDLQKTMAILIAHKEWFHIRGLCTHLAGPESISNYVRIQKQFKVFQELAQYIQSQGLKPEILHVACSAAALTYPEMQLDMVRIGILQYGFWPSQETFIHYIHEKENKNDPLKRVLRWSSSVMDVKEVRQGEFIGYGNFYQAYRDMKIAIIPVGYYNGYSRALSNQGKVLIHGERISIIGMVNMNMIVANISELSNVRIGDEVVIIGKQGKYNLSVASFSELSNQVNYELLTRLPQDINRIKTH